MIYNQCLSNIISKKKYSYVPRKLKKYESYKQYHKYWTPEFKSFFKIENIFIACGTRYYEVKFVMSNTYGIITDPYDIEDVYELMQDRNNIRELDNIINTDISYYGSEIKYWFFVHNSNTKKYNSIEQYIENNGHNNLSDNKLYFLSANIDSDGNYSNFSFKIDYNI